jgi:hypothetical protein
MMQLKLSPAPNVTRYPPSIMPNDHKMDIFVHAASVGLVGWFVEFMTAEHDDYGRYAISGG